MDVFYRLLHGTLANTAQDDKPDDAFYEEKQESCHAHLF
jgi:hypothetical protein